MKKLLKGMITTILLTVLAFNFSSIETSAATWSSWQTVSGSCKVRVSTDYSVYTSNATSVDVQAESTNCPRMDYQMDIWGIDSTGYTFMIDAINPTTGYFSYRTPVKKLYLSNLTYSTQAKVRVLVDGPSGNKAVWSNNIMIYR
ncbi:hypothetical protein [Gracilibacillus thailandensis]|uniref:Uncharacterized protein n=1 Tax=Gracilibacillus thailandensis TaxID=563735 RepID=A0A6N7QZX8_9BACI|nr:hypothetical protein [Gracilibacillus thailandensis]MRI67637.1 hypothetical protein [Gracilibacillus thailandensis]